MCVRDLGPYKQSWLDVTWPESWFLVSHDTDAASPDPESFLTLLQSWFWSWVSTHPYSWPLVSFDHVTVLSKVIPDPDLVSVVMLIPSRSWSWFWSLLILLVLNPDVASLPAPAEVNPSVHPVQTIRPDQVCHGVNTRKHVIQLHNVVYSFI